MGSNDYNLYAIRPDGTLKWKYKTGNYVYSSPAIASDGTVYVGSCDNNIYAIHSDGSLKWKFQTNDYVFSSPALGFDGTIYVESNDYNLYAIHPDGTQKWSYDIFTTDGVGSYIYSSPVIGSDGTVYVNSEDKKLYAIYPNGTLKWKSPAGSFVPPSSPAIGADGTLYVGSSDNNLYAFAPETSVTETITVISPNGSELWIVGTSYNILWASTRVENIKLDYTTDNINWETIIESMNALSGSCSWVVPSGKNSKTCKIRITDTSNTMVKDESDSFFAIIPPDGGLADSAWPMFRQNIRHTGVGVGAVPASNNVKWRFQTGNNVYSSPAIGSDGTVYVGSFDKYLYAITPTGSLKWKFQTGDGVSSSPAVSADGTVYIGSLDNYLYAITPAGSLKWKYLTDGEVASSPAIGGDGTIYIGSLDNYLYAITPTGSLKWKFRTGSWVTSSPAIGADGTIYVGSWWDNYLYAITTTGSLKWKYLTGGEVESSPAVSSDGTVYVGSHDNYLYAISPSGSLKWKFQTDSEVVSSPAVNSDGTVYVGSNDSYMYAITSTGNLKWKFQTGSSVYSSSPAIGGDGTVYVGAYDNYLYAITPSGSLKWKFQTGSYVHSSPAVGAEGTLYVGSYDSYLYAFTPETKVVEIFPPSNFQALDVPNDNGHQIKLTWTVSQSESEGKVDWYKIYRSSSNILTDPLPLTRFSSPDSLIFYEQHYTILIDSVTAGTTEYIDKFVPINNVLYYYWLQAVWQYSASQKVAAEIITFIEDEPREFHVSDPYPNPFNPYTTIQYKIPTDCYVEIIIYDILGRKISVLHAEKVSAGVHEVIWNGKNDNGTAVGSGVYLFWLKADKYIKQGKMLLMK